MKAVIFDMDGLMIDSERVTFKWYNKYLEKQEDSLSEEIYKQLLGKTLPECKNKFLETFGSDFPYEACVAWVHERMAEQFETKGVPVKKGLLELLVYLKANNYKTMVATSSERKRVDVILKKAGIDKYFDGVICGDEVVNGKPNPEVFIKACEKLGVSNDEAIVLEDSEAGIQAAFDGGIQVICIPDMKYPDEKYQKMTECILESLSEVKNYLLDD